MEKIQTIVSKRAGAALILFVGLVLLLLKIGLELLRIAINTCFFRSVYFLSGKICRFSKFAHSVMKRRQKLTYQSGFLSRLSRRLHYSGRYLYLKAKHLVGAVYTSKVLRRLSRQILYGLSYTRRYLGTWLATQVHRIPTIRTLHLRLPSLKAGWSYIKHPNPMLTVTILIGLGLIILKSASMLLASDLNQSWNFTDASQYNIDSGIETSGSTARLKAQNYTSDANTAALYHMDEASGSTASDSSSNSNNATTQNSPTFGTGNLNNAISLNGTTQNLSAPDSSSLSLSQNNSLEAWTKFSATFGANTHQQQQGILDKGSYKLYYNHQTGKITYELANSSATSWTQQGGGDVLNANGANIKGSWDTNGKSVVENQVVVGTNIYVGLGQQQSDAEVWKIDTTTNLWTQVGGDGLNSGWANGIFEEVTALATDGTNVYAGLGNTTLDAEVWRLSSGSWTKIGGDGLNSSWNTNYETVNSLAVNGTTVFAGLGNNAAGDAEVWRCTNCSTSPSWGGALIGGDAVNSSWANATYELVSSMTLDGSNNPIVGLGLTAGDAEVWRCTTNCSSGTPVWAKLGGDGTGTGGQSWGSTYQYVSQNGLVVSGSSLFVGLGNTANNGEVWYCATISSCSATAGWAIIGGSGSGTGGQSWTTGYEQVWSLAVNSSVLYAGLGNTAGDNEIWSCPIASCAVTAGWTKIAGDGTGTGGQSFSTGFTQVQTLSFVGSKLYAGLSSSGNSVSAEEWTCDVSSTCSITAGWTRVGGNYINKSWGVFNLQSVESMTTAGGFLYVGTGLSTVGNAQVWRFDGTTWAMVGGQGINSSWAANTYAMVPSMTAYGSDLVIGLGNAASAGAVWKCTGCGGSSSAWTQIGGGGTASGGQSWLTATYEEILSMAVYGGNLYIGSGTTAGDGDVWKCTGSCTVTSGWTQIGGDTLNSSWASATIETVNSMTVFGGYLFVGLGNTTNGTDSQVWRYNGTTWGGSRIAGGSPAINSSWAISTYEQVDSLVVYNGKLYAGLASGAGDAEVWTCTGCEGGSPSWGGTRIGGDSSGSDNFGWLDSTYERVRSMTVYNGELYAGLGVTAQDGEVWKYNGTTWTQIGGDGLNSGWLTGSNLENVGALATYSGRLYAGTGDTANADAAVWSYGNNAILTSAATTQDTNWHHIAATYDGTTMKLYIDGTLDNSLAVSQTIPDNSLPLLVGSTYGSPAAGQSQGYFAGSLDEVRISNTARSGFNVLPYASTPQTITLKTAAFTSGVKTYDNFISTETPNGGTIKYRVSIDGGTTWLYWDGSGWNTSNGFTDANDVATANTHIATLAANFYGIKWQAILSGNGSQQVTLSAVGMNATSDTTAPSAASAVLAYKSQGGSSLASNDWTNGSSPYFSWTAGTDGGAGVKGYCLYLGTDNTADPITTKGLLGTSPGYTGSHCQFMVSANSVDFATAGYIATPLSTSTSPYYLTVKTIDNAGNVAASGTQFHFRFDNTLPTNPAYITAPSGFINTKTVTLTWPTAGGQSPGDSASGLAGLQYKINSSPWYGDSHTGLSDINDLLTNDGTYTTTNPPDFAYINEGINTVYFRTWDVAGNITTSYVTAALKINTSGAPSEPQNLNVTPGSNTTNSFAFDWNEPATFVGDVNNLTYCYTVNTLPSPSSCTFTGAGIKHLVAGPYATQPGTNTFYIVAKDESSNINYSSYSSIDFTANTPSPGMPTNTDIVDVSIKTTNTWRLALTWDVPNDVGAGVASYKVYRSTDNITFNFVGSSSSTTYIDAGLSQITYYYYAKACDSANNCGAAGTTVSMLPTGKFTSPAVMTSDPVVSDISTTKAKISWSTDRASDSKVAIGTASAEYSPSEIGNSDQVTSHEINMANLAAGTTYYFLAKWTDEDGNTGSSQEFTFTTSPPPQVSEITADNVNLSGATISFTVKGATSANLYFGGSDAFGGVKKINTSLSSSTYSVPLSGLNDGTKYFYRISAFDSEGTEYQGNILSFTTPQRPKISNLRFQPVSGEPTSTQMVSWTTNVPSTTSVLYGINGTNGTQQDASELVIEHQIKIQGLLDASEYFLIAQGRDKDGNLAQSDRQQFHTALDTRPPKISNVTIESSIRGTGAEANGQVVVSWQTDEPSTSQVGYSEGSAATVFNSKTAEDGALGTQHIVIVSNLPTSKIYSIAPISKDRAGNSSQGPRQTAIIGHASDSVLTIILNTLQKVFGL